MVGGEVVVEAEVGEEDAAAVENTAVRHRRVVATTTPEALTKDAVTATETGETEKLVAEDVVTLMVVVLVPVVDRSSRTQLLQLPEFREHARPGIFNTSPRKKVPLAV